MFPLDKLDYQTRQKLFGDHEAARVFLEAVRWPEGPICPHCGVIGTAYKLEPKAGSKRPVRPGVYKCADCRKQFTVTVGTVFESSKVGLDKWLYAIFLMCSSKKGISANQLCRDLGVQYKTAWFLCHRIRKAMEKEPLRSKLGGVVEADETYVGGKPRKGGAPRKPGPQPDAPKTIVYTLLQRDGEARSKVVEDGTAATLQGLMQREVLGTAHIMTDGNRAYQGSDAYFRSHETVDHGAGEYVRGVVHTNFAESYFSLFKRGILGIFHHVSRKHMQRYLEEFDFRWNSRHERDLERFARTLRQVAGKRLYYRTPKEEPAW